MISSIFIFIGSLAIFVASVGIVTMPDPLSKMHAAAKASTAGIGCYAIAYVCYAPSVTAFILSTVIVLFLFLTMPIACHVLSSRYLDEVGNVNSNES